MAPGGGGGRGPGSCKPTGAGDPGAEDRGVAGAQLLMAGVEAEGQLLPPTDRDKSWGGGSGACEPPVDIKPPPELLAGDAGSRRVPDVKFAPVVPEPVPDRESRPLFGVVVDREWADGPGGSVGVPGKPTVGLDVGITFLSKVPRRHSSHSMVRHPVVINNTMPLRLAAMLNPRSGKPAPYLRHPWPIMITPLYGCARSGYHSLPAISTTPHGAGIAAQREDCKRDPLLFKAVRCLNLDNFRLASVP